MARRSSRRRGRGPVGAAGLTAARGTLIDVIPEGFEDADTNLNFIQMRLGDVSPIAPKVFRLVEQGHEAHFKRLRGRYVRTGRVKRSLTSTTGDSIRRAQPGTLVFGTSVYYAMFLRKPKRARKGLAIPDAHLGRLPNSKGRRSAVLSFTPKVKRQVGDEIIAYVTGRTGMRGD